MQRRQQAHTAPPTFTLHSCPTQKACALFAALVSLAWGCASTQSASNADSPTVGPSAVTPSVAPSSLVPDVVTSASVAAFSDPTPSEYPSCSTLASSGVSCSGTLGGVRGCRYQAGRRCGPDNYRILCLDSVGSDDRVSVQYECKSPVEHRRRARKSPMGLCACDRDCAAGPGWEEVCFSTVIAPTPTHGQCGDLRQGVLGEDRSIASAAVAEPMCSAASPCGSGETCIRLLSSRTNVCVTMQ
jgi:hypothetical protein